MRLKGIRLWLAALITTAGVFAQDGPFAGNFGPPAAGSGTDVSGTWRVGGNQDAAYGTAAGSLVD